MKKGRDKAFRFVPILFPQPQGRFILIQRVSALFAQMALAAYAFSTMNLHSFRTYLNEIIYQYLLQ